MSHLVMIIVFVAMVTVLMIVLLEVEVLIDELTFFL